jgi:hypothetical protein
MVSGGNVGRIHYDDLQINDFEEPAALLYVQNKGFILLTYSTKKSKLL